MTDITTRQAAAEFERIWSGLRTDGFALTSDRAIGLPESVRDNFSQNYYNPETLHHDPGDLPDDRKRARDVISYTWEKDILSLESYDQITITDRAGIPGKRDHSRVHLLKDPEAEELVRQLLQLTPPERRPAHGTLGVNLFELIQRL